MTTRLDAELAARGLARSRSHASQLIASGVVSVDGRPVVKPSTPVAAESEISVAGADHYVSRAAHKLIAGLDAFPIGWRGAPPSTSGRRREDSRRCCANAAPDPSWRSVGHGQLSTTTDRPPSCVGRGV